MPFSRAPRMEARKGAHCDGLPSSHKGMNGTISHNLMLRIQAGIRSPDRPDPGQAEPGVGNTASGCSARIRTRTR